MTKSLNLLLVEDSEDDELLVLREIRRGGYQVRHRRVQTAHEMRDALANDQWDMIISDHSLPHFSGPAALDMLNTSALDIPFIMTSGTLTEEAAVEALHAGAKDFLVKSRLARLVPAIDRELREAAARRGQRAAEADVKRLEEQVRQSQKMEAIGRLAGGVAHDFNNILTAIIATADLARDTPGLPDEVKNDLENIRESGLRAAAITRQLLTFSRKQVVQPRTVDLNDIVRRNESMLRRLVPPEVGFELELGATGAIEADPTQIEQVLLNLVVNAGDAMPSGGALSVSTADFEATHASRNNDKMLLPGRYVVLRVRDTGIGMDADTRAHIFEPFFTTKDPGSGTGLGLATVYGIVNQCGGHILVHSRPGEGALFEVCLPRIDGTPVAAPVAAPEAAPHAALHGSEVILVVEDEASVRAPMCRALRQLGYFVLEAGHGEDALRVLQEHHAPIHLLISDVMMPEMGGTELVHLLHDWYPHLKVLFISGYSEEMIAAKGALSPGAGYLPKPFTADQLSMRVREMLNGGDGGHTGHTP